MSSDESDDAFEESPQPTKRRRLNAPLPVFDDVESDLSFDGQRHKKSARKQRPSTSTETSKDNSAEPEQRPRNISKPKPKHLVRINADGEDFADTFQTQIPDATISSSPWRLRGARWQKLPSAPAPGAPKAMDQDGEPVPLPNDTLGAHAGQHRHPSKYDKPAAKSFNAGIKASRSRSASTSTSNHISPPIASANFDLDFDFAQELADLPSDAFASSSSSPQKSPVSKDNAAIFISSQTFGSFGEPSKLRAPQQGLQQMTLWGSNAPKDAVDKATNKKHNWPLMQKEEPPTHHKLDHEAMKTYVYPTNLGTIRDYQFSIVKRGLFHNLLVALPTGLGKTFIAATIMLNWFRWTTDAQIVFVAPTKPLVTQQVDACFNIAGIPRSQTVMLTGGISPGLRAEAWASKRVFFMTPQTIMNDLKTGICDPKRLVLIVVDEAHRATGNYAYVELVKFVRRFNQSFRVLALTATPGGTVEAVQAVVDGLKISRVEIRTEHSIDIRQYVFSRDIEIQTFVPNEEMELISDLFCKVLSPMLQKLRQHNASWTADPMQLSAYGLNMQRQSWGKSPAGKNANPGIKGMINRVFSVLASLAHNIELLKYHGISPFYHNLVAFRNNVQGVKGGKYEREVTENEHFQKMMTTIGMWVRNDTFVGHPKLEYLQSVVLNHFLDAAEGRADHGPADTKIMIFAHFRDSAEDIVRVLRRHEPTIRPHVFVGQAASKGSEGMDQKRQLEVIRDFKTGKHNTLVATSIGEEGLDIGEIDRIICYDSSASPIRMLQRMGRTGRKRAGNITLLLMKGKEENSYTSAKDGYEKMQQLIADGGRFEFHENSARRILPRGVDPVVDKCVVEIPVENSQTEPLEPKKSGRAPKRPTKKFHMPDGVRTGFVSASRMDGDEEESDDTRQPRITKRRSRPHKIVEQLEENPPLSEVLLTEQEDRELFRKYQEVSSATDADIRVPSLISYPERQRSLAPISRVKHGRATTNMTKALRSMQAIGTRRISTLIRYARKVDLDDLGGAHRVVSDREVSDPAPPQAKSRKSAIKAAAKTTIKNVTNGKRDTTKPASKAIHKPRVVAASKGAPKGRRGSRQSNDDGAIEGDASSPPPTDPRFAMATQGIDLGSDTSGEEEVEGEPSSDLRDFVVESDDEQPEAGMSSSSEEAEAHHSTHNAAMKSKSIHRQRPNLAQLVDSESEEDVDEAEDLPSLNTMIQTRMTDPEFCSAKKTTTAQVMGRSDGKRKRRVVEDSSD